MKIQSSASFSDSKPHYDLLDGLRGVAAALVVVYHIFEGYAFAGGEATITTINHGYLAVDFFFMLSGFVISYAYDDRWNKTLHTTSFFKRRLIRLHPMVIMGACIGTIAFLCQGSVTWEGAVVPFSYVMYALLLHLFLIPTLPGNAAEVRGNGEMFPLNGPSWSLFFEYLGNIIYALLLRRCSTKILAIWTACLGVALTYFAMADVAEYGCLGVGWTLDPLNFVGGSLRMLFPFSLGMLLSRTFRPFKVNGAFWICTLVLILLFHVPYLSTGLVNYNGLFEIACIALVFPLLIWLGASGTTTDVASTRICKFLGDISFPVYIIHYPLMYLFYAWLIRHQYHNISQTWGMALLVVMSSFVLAYLCLKWYDEPVRKWLRKKWMH